MRVFVFIKGDRLLTQTAECRRPDHLSCWGRSWSIVGVDQLIPLIGREQSYYWWVQRRAMGRLWIIQLVYQYHTTCTLHQKKTISTGFPKSKQLTLVGLQLPSVITFQCDRWWVSRTVKSVFFEWCTDTCLYDRRTEYRLPRLDLGNWALHPKNTECRTPRLHLPWGRW